MYNLCRPISKKECMVIEGITDASIEAILGSKYTISYRMLADTVREELFDKIEEAFGTRKITSICKCRYNEILDFIIEWFPNDDIMKLSCELEEALSNFIYHFADNIPKESSAYQEIMEDFINALCTSSEGLE